MLEQARQQKIVPVDLENPEIRQRVKHVLESRDERLGQFYARTGLGRHQIEHMSKDEISQFVARATQNNADDPAAPAHWEPAKTPKKFFLW